MPEGMTAEVGVAVIAAIMIVRVIVDSVQKLQRRNGSSRPSSNSSLRPSQDDAQRIREMHAIVAARDNLGAPLVYHRELIESLERISRSVESLVKSHDEHVLREERAIEQLKTSNSAGFQAIKASLERHDA